MNILATARIFDRNLVIGETSMPGRTNACYDWAERHRLRILDEHIAWGASADTAKPTELVEAVELCAAEGSTLIVYNDDVLSKDPATVQWARVAMGNLAIEVVSDLRSAAS
jgi:hypothetical protein